MKKLLLFALLLPRLAWAAIALDATSGVQSNTSTVSTSVYTVTISTAGAGELVVVTINLVNTGATSCPVSGSSLGAFTALVTETGSGLKAFLLWKWASAQLTSEVITSACDGAGLGSMDVQALTGARDPTSLVAGTDFATGHSNGGSGTQPSISITTIGSSGSWLIGGADAFRATAWTPDANSTTEASFFIAAGSGFMTERYTNPVSAGAHTIGGTWTGSDTSWAMTVAEVLAAGGAAATPRRTLTGVGQ